LLGSERRWAIAVCFDMDFPALVRDYRRSGATVVFVPAWDFGRDAWLHSRMAITRGVENGLTVVRAARQGLLTVSDPHGRVLAEAPTKGASLVSVTSGLPRRAVPTLYTKFGDWLAWTCILLLLAGSAAGLLITAITSRRRSGAHREPSAPQVGEAGPHGGERTSRPVSL
jgi:apolipoprotein N-acyltransferase